MNEMKSTYEILNRTDLSSTTILTISETRYYNGKYKETIWTVVTDCDGNDYATSGESGNHYDLVAPRQPSIARLVDFVCNADL
jgi:hypothetical protein